MSYVSTGFTLSYNTNVVANIEVPGKLYGRQGTQFDFRILTVDGRKDTPEGIRPTTRDQVQRVNTIDELLKITEEVIKDEKGRLATEGTKTVGPRPAGPGVTGERGGPGAGGELHPHARPEGAGPGEEVPTGGGRPGITPGKYAGPGVGAGTKEEKPTGGPGIVSPPHEVKPGVAGGTNRPEPVPPKEVILERPKRPTRPGRGEQGPGAGEGVPGGVRGVDVPGVPSTKPLTIDEEARDITDAELDDLLDEAEKLAEEKQKGTKPEVKKEKSTADKMLGDLLSQQEERKPGEPFFKDVPSWTELLAREKKEKALSEAANKIVEAGKEAKKGLDELFGPGERGSLSFEFNEDLYNKAKVHFKASWAAARQAGQKLVEWARDLIIEYGNKIKAYVKRFVQEVRQQEAEKSKSGIVQEDEYHHHRRFKSHERRGQGIFHHWRTQLRF
jgi:hypothetical protein